MQRANREALAPALCKNLHMQSPLSNTRTFAPIDMPPRRAWAHCNTMSTYGPNRVPGPTWFFTVRLADPSSTLLTEHISAFGEAIRQARGKKPFHVDAWVVLHDHAHAIWTLPPGDADCASRWRAVKIAFSNAVRKARPAAPRGAAIWQRHYQQHAVIDDHHYRRLVDYVHANPVSHGICAQPFEWPWSSVHRFVAQGFIISPDRNGVLASGPSSTSGGNTK